MTWLHIYDLLRTQDRFFPQSDVRPFAPLPSSWAEIETTFRKEESQARDRLEAAVREFIHRGSWPTGLSAREKVFIRGRLDFACDTALRLAVPMPGGTISFPMSCDTTDADVFSWLLIMQWDALGFDSWILELHHTFGAIHNNKRAFESLPLPPHLRPDDPSSFFSKN